MATIRVPGPSPQAFRKNRPISDLVKSQIKHFQHLEHKLQLTLPTKFSPRTSPPKPPRLSTSLR